jgi:hypothetical protein
MDYKSLMGYGKKKTPTKEKQPKPKKNQILEGIKRDLNEWNDETFKTLPKRWSKTLDPGLTEFEKQGGKDTLKEVGAAPQYKKFVKSIDKERNKVGKETLQFVDLLRKKGLGDAADDLLDSYKNNIVKFGIEVKKIMRKII